MNFTYMFPFAFIKQLFHHAVSLESKHFYSFLILRLSFPLSFIYLLPQAQKWIFSLERVFSFQLYLEILLFYKMTC